MSAGKCSHCLGGTLHTFFEGYFVLNNSTIGSKQTLFAQLWKEYALADSRYLTGDLVVLCAEALTLLLWGPLSYLTAAAIIKSSPWRHPLQIIVSMGQALGDLLYMSTSLVDLYARQNLYSRPEPYYLWFYFFAMNAIWLVVPGGMGSPTNLLSSTNNTQSSSIRAVPLYHKCLVHWRKSRNCAANREKEKPWKTVV